MKKLLTILVLIMLIISFFQITSMYALYKEQIQGEYTNSIGAWQIKVNDTDITSNGQQATFTIAGDQLEYIPNENVQAGKIAPGGQAYFDIIIDPLETDVAVIYTIEADTEAMLGQVPIVVTNVQNYFVGKGEDGQTKEITNNVFNINGYTYTSVIPVNMITQGYKNYIRIYLQWWNDETGTYDEQDSIIGESENAKISIPLTINLKQYTGEDISNAI